MQKPHHDLPDSDYDRHADFYLEFVGQVTEAGVPDHARVLLELLGDVAGCRICDLACGEGYLSRILAERGAAVTGVDISERLLARAKELGGAIEYIRDDAQVLSRLPDSCMDAVVCNMALMDIADLDATIQSVRRVLTDTGRFAFCVLHPCFFTPFNARNPPVEFDDDGAFRAHRTYRYSEEGKWFSDGKGMCGTLGGHHRTLSTYINCLASHGLRLSEVREPVRPPDGTRTDPHSVVPGHLMAAADVVG